MFDWDPQKARANQLKHGVPFEEAATAFLDPEGLVGDEVMKRSRGLSAQGGQAGKKGKDTRSKKIDFSDIPELSEKQLSRMRRVGRPTLGDEPRKLIAIRLDPKVLGWLRRTAEKKGLPYQSLVNQIVAEEMKKAS